MFLATLSRVSVWICNARSVESIIMLRPEVMLKLQCFEKKLSNQSRKNTCKAIYTLKICIAKFHEILYVFA